MFFQTLDVPYKAYQAENPQQVEEAIHDIDRLERYPITYTERLPRQDLTVLAYAIAGLFVALLAAAKMAETRLVPRRRAARSSIVPARLSA